MWVRVPPGAPLRSKEQRILLPFARFSSLQNVRTYVRTNVRTCERLGSSRVLIGALGHTDAKGLRMFLRTFDHTVRLGRKRGFVIILTYEIPTREPLEMPVGDHHPDGRGLLVRIRQSSTRRAGQSRPDHRPRGIPRGRRDAGREPHGCARVRQVARHRLVAVDQLEQAAQPQLRELKKDTRLPLSEGRGKPVREMRRIYHGGNHPDILPLLRG